MALEKSLCYCLPRIEILLLSKFELLCVLVYVLHCYRVCIIRIDRLGLLLINRRYKQSNQDFGLLICTCTMLVHSSEHFVLIVFS